MNTQVKTDCIIRTLATNHYKYGGMPLCIGKTRGIRNILEDFYSINVSFKYVWNVLEAFHNEPKE